MLYAGQEIILYGSGRRCARILPLLIRAHISIKSVIDSNQVKWGKRIENIEILSPEILSGCKNTVVCITVADQAEQEKIRDMLRCKHGYDLRHEIRYDDLALEAVLLIQKAKIDQIDFTKNRRNHIVFDCISGLGLGGIEEWTKGLCMELLKEGFGNLHIFTDTGEYTVPDDLAPIVDKVLNKDSNRFKEDILDCIMEYLTTCCQ